MTGKGIRSTKGRGRLFDSVLDTVGDTPAIRLNNIAPKGVKVYVKAEFFNPAASVKDRLALNIIEAAEREGRLKPGQTVVEATSGNTGIGLAMVCAQKGYPLVLVMPESFSIERRRLMRFLGAKVILTTGVLPTVSSMFWNRAICLSVGSHDSRTGDMNPPRPARQGLSSLP